MTDYLHAKARTYVELLKADLWKIAEMSEDMEVKKRLLFLLSNMEFPRLVTYYDGKVYPTNYRDGKIYIEGNKEKPVITDYAIQEIFYDYWEFYNRVAKILNLSQEVSDEIHAIFDEFSRKLHRKLLNPPSDPTWSKPELFISKEILDREPVRYIKEAEGFRKETRFEKFIRKTKNLFRKKKL